MGEQLDLFGSVQSVDDVDWRMPIPAIIDLENFSVENWMGWLAKLKSKLVFLFDIGDGMCNVRCESSWEGRMRPFVDSAVIQLEEAVEFFREKGYVKHSNYSSSTSRAQVYVRW
jgi:hypothetical protein